MGESSCLDMPADQSHSARWVANEGKGQYRLRWANENANLKYDQIDFKDIKEVIDSTQSHSTPTNRLIVCASLRYSPAFGQVIEDTKVYRKRRLLSDKISQKVLQNLESESHLSFQSPQQHLDSSVNTAYMQVRFHVIHKDPNLSLDFKSQKGKFAYFILAVVMMVMIIVQVIGMKMVIDRNCKGDTGHIKCGCFQLITAEAPLLSPCPSACAGADRTREARDWIEALKLIRRLDTCWLIKTSVMYT